MSSLDLAILAGARLRPTHEVDRLQGDKLLAEVSEVQRIGVDADGTIVGRRQVGTVRLLNPSQDSRLWDVDLVLHEDGDTDLGTEHLPVDALEAGEKAELTYTFGATPQVWLDVHLDSEPSRPKRPSRSLARESVPARVEVRYTLRHTGAVPLDGVELRWPIPQDALLPTIPDGCELVEDEVRWHLGHLQPGAQHELLLHPTFPVRETERVALAPVHVEWQAEALPSGTRVREVDAFCRAFSRVDITPAGPARWNVRAVFENRSSFVVDPTLLELVRRDTGETVLHIEDVEGDIGPRSTWRSALRAVASETEPTLRHTLAYSVIGRLTTLARGTLEHQLPTLPVLDAEVAARLDRSMLRPNRDQRVEATVDVEVTGSAPVQLARVTVDLPSWVAVADDTDITVWHDDDLLDEEHAHIERAADGASIIAVIGATQPISAAPGDRLRLRLGLMASTPAEPLEDPVPLPIRVALAAERDGPVATRRPTRPARLHVTHRRRRTTEGKEIRGGSQPGEYRAQLLFRNRSDGPIGDLVLYDLTPPGCRIGEVTVTSDSSGPLDPPARRLATPDGTRLEWSIERVDVGESIEIEYTLDVDPETELSLSDAPGWFGSEGGIDLES